MEIHTQRGRASERERDLDNDTLNVFDKSARPIQATIHGGNSELRSPRERISEKGRVRAEWTRLRIRQDSGKVKTNRQIRIEKGFTGEEVKSF